MTAVRCESKLTLKLVSPFLFQSVVNTRVGIDCACMRNAAGRPVIPAAQVKGVLRDVLETLASLSTLITEAEIHRLFGKSSSQGDQDSNIPTRGVAIFSDLVAHEVPDRGHTTRIEIDDDTGAVKKGGLQVIELAAPFGAKVDFSGSLIIRYLDGLDRQRCEEAFSKALRLIPAMGALKSAGFGEVDPDGCALELVSVMSLVPPQTKERAAERVTYSVKFDRPLLIDARYITDNLFESEKIVPGAVFKGALAERLALAGENSESRDCVWSRPLEQLRISHAFPAVDGKQGELPIPASIVFQKKDQGVEYADAIVADQVGAAPLWGQEVAQFVAGAKKEIQKRWREDTGTPEWRGDYLPRTHIALNENAGERIGPLDRLYTAADGMLYSTVMLSVDNQAWLLTIDAAHVDDKEHAHKLIRILEEEGLDGIGKTSASANFSRVLDAAVPQLPKVPIIDLILKTPAVMFDPTQDRSASMAARYADYFRNGFGATLRNVFARQYMAGGYQAMRRKPYRAYYPFVLTEAGAVFRLEITDPKSRQQLEDALRFGLRVPNLGTKASNWQTCPFVRESGYGEISLHEPAGLSTGVLSFVCETGDPNVRRPS
jgi:CRISPR/Cas system CSM-associated protein Csm3 (group 7 of RAMP superfamily)